LETTRLASSCSGKESSSDSSSLQKPGDGGRTAAYAAVRRKALASYDHSQRLQGVGNLRPELVDYLIQLPQREHLQLRFRLAQKRYDTTWERGGRERYRMELDPTLQQTGCSALGSGDATPARGDPHADVMVSPGPPVILSC